MLTRTMDRAVHVRRVAANDALAIAEFQTACWREAYRGVVPERYLDRVGVANREARWRERLVTGTQAVALAEVDGAVVGVVSWGPSRVADAPTLELMTLYVAAEHRGTGLASRLLRRAVGDSAAYLWVFEDNPRARSCYARHGFRPDGCHQTDPDTGLRELRHVRP